jgi:hypothetical protein
LWSRLGIAPELGFPTSLSLGDANHVFPFL